MKVLVTVGATVWAQAMMHKVVVQMVLLYGIESFVVMDAMPKVLEGYHHRVYWRIEGMKSQRFGEEGWSCHRRRRPWKRQVCGQ